MKRSHSGALCESDEENDKRESERDRQRETERDREKIKANQQNEKMKNEE
jgi:hypothetical protein